MRVIPDPQFGQIQISLYFQATFHRIGPLGKKNFWTPPSIFHPARPLGQAESWYWCICLSVCVCLYICPSRRSLILKVPFGYIGPLDTFWTLCTFRYILNTFNLSVLLDTLNLCVSFEYSGTGKPSPSMSREGQSSWKLCVFKMKYNNINIDILLNT